MKKEDLLISKVDEEKKNVESEEKLSMTRELKFKELQEKIDDEEDNRVIEEAILKSKKKTSTKKVSSELEKEIDALLEVENKKKKKKKPLSQKQIEEFEKVLEETVRIPKRKLKEELEAKKEEVVINKVENDDDIYLTASFKPIKKKFRLKKVFRVFLKLLFVLLLLGAFGYFVIYPLYKMINDSKPISIYSNTIDYISDSLNEFVDKVYIEDDGSYKLDSKVLVNTNINKYLSLNNSKLSLSNGIDFNNNTYNLEMYVEDENNKYGFNLVEKNNSNYYNLSTSNFFIKNVYSYKDTKFVEFFDDLDEVNAVSKEDYKYYINKTSSVLKKLIKEEDLTISKEEIEVDSVSDTVVRNTFKLDKVRLEKFEKDLSKVILKDDKYLEIESKLTGKSLEEVKTKYESVTEYEKDYTLVFNIYTKNGTKFVGFDIEENGFRNIYYYNIKNKFEFHLNVAENDTCRKAGNCVNNDVIDIIGTKKDKVTKLKLIYNNEDRGTLNIKEYTDKRISLDYNLVFNNNVYQGSFVLGYDSKNHEYSGTISYMFNDEFLDMNFVSLYDKNAAVVDNLDSKVINYNSDTLEMEEKVFNDKLKEVKLEEVYNAYEMLFLNFSKVKKISNS